MGQCLQAQSGKMKEKGMAASAETNAGGRGKGGLCSNGSFSFSLVQNDEIK